MNLQESVSAVERYVTEGGRVTGAKLSGFLRTLDPAWSPLRFGQKSIAAFITAHVPNVSIAGRAGLDPIYALATGAAEQIALSSAHDEIWRAWASPNAQYIVEVNAAGQVRVVKEDAPTDANWARLESPRADDHRTIARDFLTLQFPGGDESLSSAITEHPDWWKAWFSKIRKRKLNHVWGEFRTARMVATFEEALRHSTIPESAQKIATTELKRSAAPGADLQLALSAQSEGATKSELRHIAATVVDRMSERDLAELRLPLGLVLDAIKNAR